MRERIGNFTDLAAYQEAHRLALDVYHITKTLPKEEQFGLTNQLRRAAISATSNIAEGFGRSSAKDKRYFTQSPKVRYLKDKANYSLLAI